MTHAQVLLPQGVGGADYQNTLASVSALKKSTPGVGVQTPVQGQIRPNAVQHGVKMGIEC